MTESESSLHSDVACTVCGCVCDDLELRIERGIVSPVRGACSLALPWFAALNDPPPPAAAVRGQAVDVAEATSAAAQLLAASRAPLVYGLSRSSTPGQQAAVRLAETLGATIDTTASVCHGPSIMAIQRIGESTCSLGEIRQRADLVLFWGADPEKSHPRHLERYSAAPDSEFLPRGRADRTLVVVDVKPTATAAIADLMLQVAPGRDLEMIWALRQLIRDPSIPLAVDCGVPVEALRDLAARMTSCRYGAVFFGLGVAQQPYGHLSVEALLQLVADLNGKTRFVARRLRIPGDVAGADSVLCWQTGFPFAVNFGRGSPRYNPGEFTANELLERNEVDCCVIVGSESVASFSDAALATLRRLPTILLDYPHQRPPFVATVSFTTAVYGVHAAGTAYRMDETPIPLRRLCSSPFPTDEVVLEEIQRRVRDDSPGSGTAPREMARGTAGRRP